MESENTVAVVDALLNCITIINAASEEEATLDGVMSGRIIAQVLTQINTKLVDDEELSHITNFASDENIPVAVRDMNYRVIMDRLGQLFDPQIYDYENCDEWHFEPSDIVYRRDLDAISRFLIVVVTAAVISEGKARSPVQKFLEQTNEPEKSQISGMLNGFLQAIKRIQAPSPSHGVDFLQYQTMRMMLSKSKEKVERLKREKEELSAEINTLSNEIQQMRKEDDDRIQTQSALSDAEAKIKHLESVSASHVEHLLQAQKQVQELEFENEKLQRKLSTQDTILSNLRTENKELVDECEGLRSSEAQLKRELKNVGKNATLAERDSTALKNKEKELELTKMRVNSYIAQLTEFESLKTKVVSMEQMMSNVNAQRDELKDELQRALHRANNAEAEIVSLRQQLRKETHAKTEENPRDFSPALTLQDELNGSMNESHDGHSLEEIAELKTRYELLKLENNRVKTELQENKEMYEALVSSSDSRISMEKEEVERLQVEKQGLAKRVTELENLVRTLNERISSLEVQKEDDQLTISKLEKHLDSAANVIRFYSTASDGRESSAENLRLRSENEKLQKELETLKAKMDEKRYESCQEQRLITTNWYGERRKNFRLLHGLGSSRGMSGTAKSTVPPPTNNSVDSGANSHSAHNSPHQKTFITRQLEAANFTTGR
ncbi:hypothetical protein Ddc_02304 [Ditylenchus destructor]|nr:hypothetical protein Ddc_02304 [Ditylenchus destructor]